MTAYYLLFLGLLLIFLEFYLPGMVLGVMGGVSLVAGFVWIVMQEGSVVDMLLYIGLGSLSLYGVVKLALWSIPKAKISRSLYLKGDQEGYVASSYDKGAIGKSGTVLTDLKPGGYISVEGDRGGSHPANSVSGYLERGTPVVVIGGEGENLIVKKKV